MHSFFFKLLKFVKCNINLNEYNNTHRTYSTCHTDLLQFTKHSTTGLKKGKYMSILLHNLLLAKLRAGSTYSVFKDRVKSVLEQE